jgi:hypothetical protein
MMAKLDITVRDLLTNLNPTFEDSVIADGEPFYRGEI